MQLVNLSEAPDYDIGKIRDGDLDSKHLLHGAEGTPNNYRVALTTARTAWPAPRHRHNFDQIRLPINGAFEYAKATTLPAGWIGYFPEGAYYGPQLCQPGLQMLVIQFGGASGSGYLTKGALAHGGERFDLHSAFGFEAHEGPITLEGVEDAELLRVQLPRF